MEEYAEFTLYVVKSLVSHPDYVKLSSEKDDMGVLLTIEVHPDDMGKLLGKQGNTAKALRTLVRGVGMKCNARVSVHIAEPEGSVHEFGK